MAQPKLARSRATREYGGRTRGGAGQEPREHGDGGAGTRSEPQPEPTLAELAARADALRRTGEALMRRMSELAAQIDVALSKRDPREPALSASRRGGVYGQ